MKRNILLLAFAVWSVPTTAAARSSSISTQCPRESAIEQRRIRQTLENWRTAYNSGDWPRTIDLVAPDQIGWAANGNTIDYASQLDRARQRAAANVKPSGRYDLSVEEIAVCGDMALVRDVWTFVPDNGDPQAGKAVRSFEFFRRQPNGSWKISRWMDALAPKRPK